MWIVPIGNDETYSDECAPGGNGQCDGNDYDNNVPCDCGCHNGWDTADLNTVPEFAAWHVELWATYEPDNPYRPRKVV